MPWSLTSLAFEIHTSEFPFFVPQTDLDLFVDVNPGKIFHSNLNWFSLSSRQFCVLLGLLFASEGCLFLP